MKYAEADDTIELGKGVRQDDHFIIPFNIVHTVEANTGIAPPFSIPNKEVKYAEADDTLDWGK